MITTFKIIHLLALMFGAASSFGSIYLGLAKGPHDLAAPDYTNMLRKMFRTFGLAAVLVLWISGLLLMFGKYGVWVPRTVFTIKIIFVILITIYLLYINFMASSWARNGGPPSYLPLLGWVSAICLVGAVVSAVLAFA